MLLNIRVIFCLFFLLALSAPSLSQEENQPNTEASHEKSCNSLLSQGHWAKILERVEAVSPELYQKFKQAPLSLETVQTLHLDLRKRAWDFAPHGLVPFKDKADFPAQLQQHLRLKFSKQFLVEELDEDDLYLFYTNALQSAYLAVLRYWMDQTVADILADQQPTAFIKKWALAIMGRYLPSVNLQNPALEPSLAEDFFNKASWISFPWKSALQIARDWEALENSSTDLHDWLSHHSVYKELEISEQKIVESSLQLPKYPEACCLSEPGCSFCPNNRAWLKKNNKEL